MHSHWAAYRCNSQGEAKVKLGFSLVESTWADFGIPLPCVAS